MTKPKWGGGEKEKRRKRQLFKPAFHVFDPAHSTHWSWEQSLLPNLLLLTHWISTCLNFQTSRYDGIVDEEKDTISWPRLFSIQPNAISNSTWSITHSVLYQHFFLASPTRSTSTCSFFPIFKPDLRPCNVYWHYARERINSIQKTMFQLQWVGPS